MESHARQEEITPGEIFPRSEPVTLNAGRPTCMLTVLNTGDRPVQVGSHYHFFEVNRALQFDRAAAFGFHLDIPAGTAVRFEPGEEKEVTLVLFGGQRRVLGLNALTDGEVTSNAVKQNALITAEKQGFLMKSAPPIAHDRDAGEPSA